MEKFERLREFKAIGWDFDETIVDSANEEAIWEFIDTNPFGQEHNIITFRSGGMESYMFHDLDIRGSWLKPHHFKNIFTVPHALWETYKLGPKIITLDMDDPYVMWKGMTCAENGIPVLIDDATHNVARGCLKYGIELFHPDEF